MARRQGSRDVGSRMCRLGTMTLLVDRLEVEGTGPELRCRRVALVVGASGLVTTLVVQLEYEGTSPELRCCGRVALDVGASGLVTTLVGEVLEVEGSGMFPSTATQSGLSRYFPGTSGAG